MHVSRWFYSEYVLCLFCLLQDLILLIACAIDLIKNTLTQTKELKNAIIQIQIIIIMMMMMMMIMIMIMMMMLVYVHLLPSYYGSIRIERPYKILKQHQ
jgi:hypothetical protein